MLSVFAMLNAAGWAALALAWAFRPEWAERLPATRHPSAVSQGRPGLGAPGGRADRILDTGGGAVSDRRTQYRPADRDRPLHHRGGLPDHRDRGRHRRVSGAPAGSATGRAGERPASALASRLHLR